MAVSSNQLANEYEEIRRRFAASPYIQIAATTGTPPESYEIVYHVKGIGGLTDGRPVTVDNHRVSIVLPFGYPHFPPNCKPLTPIFHPDFDPDAICIGDFWNSSRSLPDLIVHIARLIAYQTYSRQDVFNREALDWALTHGDLLPLDSADFGAAPQVSAAEEEELRLEIAEMPEAVSREFLQAAAGGEEEEVAAAVAPAAAPAQPVADRSRRGAGRRAAGAGSGKARKIMAAVGGMVLLLAAVAGGLLFLDLRHYEAAQRQWGGVTALVGENRFAEADQRIKEALARLDKVRFLKKNEKQVLREEIGRLSGSQEFQAGLQGKILINGRYITTQQQQEITAVNELLGQGRELAAAGKWREAAEAYGRAAEKTASLKDLAPMPADQVGALLNRSLMQAHIQDGNSFRAVRKWDDALRSFAEAQRILDGLQGEDLAATRSEVQAIISEVGFTANAERGDGFFAAKQWAQAAESYEAALRAVERGRGDLATTVRKIEGQRDVAGFNASHEAGLKDWQEGRWDAAIRNLEKSEGLLAGARAAGGARDITPQLIKRKIVFAAIKRDEAAVAAALAAEKYDQAGKTLQSLVAAIDRSGLAAEREFAAARSSAVERIKTYQFQDEIQQKINYLLARYETIFKDFFPSSARSTLSEPKITYVKRQGSLLVFNMQCQEENRQQKFTLEMNYQYDTASGKWGPHP
jgi:ubiquitin-protein ligase/transposase